MRLFKNNPGIVVTRPREQAGHLAALIKAAGGRPLLFPAIEIEPLPDWPLPRLDESDLAIFVSPTAAHAVMRRVGAWPQRLRAAAVGQGTRRELERYGIGHVLAPASGADSEALLAQPELAQVDGARIVIFRGEGGRELLGVTLSARGARVEHVACYRRQRPQADPAPLLAAWERGALHAVTVSSGEGLENLCALLGEPGRARLAATPLFVPHARVAGQARELGMREVLVAGPGDEEVVARLVAYFAPP